MQAKVYRIGDLGPDALRALRDSLAIAARQKELRGANVLVAAFGYLPKRLRVGRDEIPGIATLREAVRTHFPDGEHQAAATAELDQHVSALREGEEGDCEAIVQPNTKRAMLLARLTPAAIRLHAPLGEPVGHYDLVVASVLHELGHVASWLEEDQHTHRAVYTALREAFPWHEEVGDGVGALWYREMAAWLKAIEWIQKAGMWKPALGRFAMLALQSYGVPVELGEPFVAAAATIL